ncbi:MAG: 50S ribosomal protein L6 [Opitutales bacterium]
MSRIGKLPVSIPAGVEVSVTDHLVSVSGPKGKLEQSFSELANVVVRENEVRVSPADDTRAARAMYGTARAIVANMVKGVVETYSKDLLLQGVGFRATVQGNLVNLELGYSHPINYSVLEGVTVTVADNVKIRVEGSDKQKVGQVTADIKSFYPAEPYKGKGVRIVGDYVRRKEGKKSA